MPRKQVTAALNMQIVPDISEIDRVEEGVLDDYKKLNDKCDTVITKIKDRKKNKRKN